MNKFIKMKLVPSDSEEKFFKEMHIQKTVTQPRPESLLRAANEILNTNKTICEKNLILNSNLNRFINLMSNLKEVKDSPDMDINFNFPSENPELNSEKCNRLEKEIDVKSKIDNSSNLNSTIKKNFRDPRFQPEILLDDIATGSKEYVSPPAKESKPERDDMKQFIQKYASYNKKGEVLNERGEIMNGTSIEKIIDHVSSQNNMSTPPEGLNSVIRTVSSKINQRQIPRSWKDVTSRKELVSEIGARKQIKNTKYQTGFGFIPMIWESLY